MASRIWLVMASPTVVAIAAIGTSVRVETNTPMALSPASDSPT